MTGWGVISSILQGNGGSDWLGCYIGPDADPIGCSFELLVAPLGETVMGIVVGGALILGFYQAGDGSLAAPSVLVALVGAALLPLLPGGLSTMATTIMFLGLVGGGLALLNKYVMRPGV